MIARDSRSVCEDEAKLLAGDASDPAKVKAAQDAAKAADKMKAGTTTVVTGFLVPLPATRSESVFSKILLILNNLKKIMKSFANAYVK